MATGGAPVTYDASTRKYKYLLDPRQTTRFPPLHHTPLWLPNSASSFLALMNFGFSTYSYNLPQLGYPHEQAERQQTQPFWQQEDFVEQFSRPPHICPTYGYTHYNYVYDPFAMQDFVPVFIGSNTANGKIVTGQNPSRLRQHRQTGHLRRHGRVDVYIDNVYVKDVSMQELIRFSRTIGAKFSTSQQEKTEISSREALGVTVEVVQMGLGVQEVKLVNDHSKFWVAPASWAFEEVLAWMHKVFKLPKRAELPHFTVEYIEQYTLHELIEVYAAALVLDVRPRSVLHQFRGTIFNNLSYYPSTAEDFKYLHEHLPAGDPILRKLVETFIMHGERKHYKSKHLRGEVTRIQEYVNGCKDAAFKSFVVDTQLAYKEKEDARKESEREKVTAAGKTRSATHATRTHAPAKQAVAHVEETAGRGTADKGAVGKQKTEPDFPTLPSESESAVKKQSTSPTDSAVGCPRKSDEEVRRAECVKETKSI